MFEFFTVACCFTLLALITSPWSLSSRRGTIVPAVFAFITALCCVVATIVATILFTVFRNALMDLGAGLNIKAEIGTAMFAFMWTGTAFSVVAWCLQAGQLCCCLGPKNTGTEGGEGNEKAVSSLNKVETENIDGHANNGQGQYCTSGRLRPVSQNF